MRRHGRTALLTIALLTLWLPVNAAAAPPPDRNASTVYSFGVVPQFEQRKLFAIWKPIVAELERQTGLTFRLVTTLKIEDFEREFLRGKFDFVYTNPYHMTKTPSDARYLPLVADAAPLRGILVVPAQSPIREVTELDGKVVAFPAPNAIGACLVMRADLERLHHVTVRPLYVKTHSSVYLHVVQGLAAAGGGVEKTLQEQEPAVRSALRVIYTTRSLPSHPIAAHPRVPQAHREQVRKALLAMGTTAAGRELLARVPMKRVIPVTWNDYRRLGEWGLDRYWDPTWKGE